MQRQHFSHFHLPYKPETFQRGLLDSLGMGAVKIGCIIAPDRRQHRQEALMRILATPAAFLRFCVGFLQRAGVWGGLCSFHVLRCSWGALKGKIHAGGQKPPTCFGTSGASGTTGVVWRHRG